MKQLVTVVIPIGRVTDHLDDCISSVANQTYSQLEIILINGDLAEKVNKVDKWTKKDPRIKVIDGGTSSVQDAIHGEYVVYIDPNDWLNSNMVESMLNAFDDYNVDMVECQFLYNYADGNQLLAYEGQAEPQCFNQKAYIKLLVKDNDHASCCLWRKAFKRSLLADISFSAKIRIKNAEALARVLPKIDNVACLQDPLYYRRKGKHELPPAYQFWQAFKDYQSCYDQLLKVAPDLRRPIESGRAYQYIEMLKWVSDEPTNKDKQAERMIIRYLKNSHFQHRNLDDQTLTMLLNIIPNKPFLAVSLWKKENHTYSPSRGRRLFRIIREYKGVLLSHEKLFVLLGRANHGNLGDRAISIAEDQFISQYFSDYKQVNVNLSDVKLFGLLHFFIRRDSIIAIQGGGNLGTLYPWINEVTTKVLISLRKRLIIIFPQTYYFLQDKGNLKQKMRAIYQKVSNLFIFTRDPQSYRLVRQELCDNVDLVPDMALMLQPKIKHCQRKNALIILRDDNERTLNDSDRQRIVNSIKRLKVARLVYADTYVHYSGLDDRFAKYLLNSLWDKYFHARVVVTDRLHGMIFAAITNTPCVAVQSQSPKIKGVYDQWLKENDFIELVEDPNDVSKAIQRVTSIRNPRLKRDKLNVGFAEMVKQIKKMVEEK